MSNVQVEYYHLVEKSLFFIFSNSSLSFQGNKTTDNNKNANCIITVLDANDLPPLNSNTSLTAIANEHSTNSSTLPSSNPNPNRRHENRNRNVLHRFLIFHRSDQSQT
jgi:hypothetical protein